MLRGKRRPGSLKVATFMSSSMDSVRSSPPNSTDEDHQDCNDRYRAENKTSGSWIKVPHRGIAGTSHKRCDNNGQHDPNRPSPARHRLPRFRWKKRGRWGRQLQGKMVATVSKWVYKQQFRIKATNVDTQFLLTEQKSKQQAKTCMYFLSY